MTYRVKFEVANPGLPSGDAEFEIEVHPEWAPLGAKCACANLHPPAPICVHYLVSLHPDSFSLCAGALKSWSRQDISRIAESTAPSQGESTPSLSGPRAIRLRARTLTAASLETILSALREVTSAAVMPPRPHDQHWPHRPPRRFIVQWGIPSDPQLYLKYGENKIKDVRISGSNPERPRQSSLECTALPTQLSSLLLRHTPVHAPGGWMGGELFC